MHRRILKYKQPQDELRIVLYIIVFLFIRLYVTGNRGENVCTRLMYILRETITQARKATNRTESEHINVCTFESLNYKRDLAITGYLDYSEE